MENETLNPTAPQPQYRYVPPANPRQEREAMWMQSTAVCVNRALHVGAMEAPSPADPLPPPSVAEAAPAQSAPWGAPAAVLAPPAKQLKKKPGLVKYLLLSFVTLGIYAIVVMSGISSDINTIASPHDKKKTMHYCLLLFLCSLFTLGIVPLIWYHRLSKRIGNEARRRGILTTFGAKTFWLWGILGSFIVVGPYIYLYRLLKNMNALIADYNQKG